MNEIELMNEQLREAEELPEVFDEEELAEPVQKVKCPIEGDEFDSYEEFEAHWRKEHESKYGKYAEFEQPPKLSDEKIVEEMRLQGLSKELEDISKDFLKSEEYREALLKECLSILESIGNPTLGTVDFEALKEKAEHNIMKRAVKGTKKTSISEELQETSTSITDKNLLSRKARVLWELYEGDRAEFLSMQEWIFGRHTGKSVCPICRKTVFTLAEVPAKMGRAKRTPQKDITCLEHMEREHPEDFKRYMKLGKVAKMSFYEYVENYSDPEKLSEKETLSKEELFIAEAFREEVEKEVEETSKEDTVPKPKSKIPNSKEE